ncbi:MAG TPA: hypothetical protein DCF49_05410 [Lachnospiraceae bacterium]|nr:hypothetical protein [Lachnospiraceae bacterium]
MMSKNIKHWLKIRNMTMQELADRLHVSVGTLSYWINAEEIPSYVLKRISEILRVPVENLVGVC